MTVNHKDVMAKSAAIVSLTTFSHAAGDKAAKAAKATSNRKDQRHANAINLAARATATAGEASLWLAKTVSNSMEKRRVKEQAGLAAMDRMLSISLQTLDDLNQETATLMAYKPQYRR